MTLVSVWLTFSMSAKCLAPSDRMSLLLTLHKKQTKELSMAIDVDEISH